MKICELENCNNEVVNQNNRFCSIRCRNIYVNVVAKQKQSEKRIEYYKTNPDICAKEQVIELESVCEKCGIIFLYNKKVTCKDATADKLINKKVKKYVRKFCNLCYKVVRAEIASRIGKKQIGTFEEHFGKEKANLIKAKLSEKNSGKNNPRYNRIIKQCAFCKKDFLVIPFYFLY